MLAVHHKNALQTALRWEIMLAIKNATLIMRDHLIPDAVLFIEDGLIKDFGEMRSTPIPEGCTVIDAKGQ